jgi:peptide deformylase
MNSPNLPSKVTLHIGPQRTEIVPDKLPIPVKELAFVPQDDPVLHKPCQDALVGGFFLKENQSLVNCMLDVVRIKQGLGLSANQLGIDRRIFVLDIPTQFGTAHRNAFFNPTITQSSDEFVEGMEGCLSLPYISHTVKRPTWVVLQWQNIDGSRQEAKFHGLTARVICHEMDHLAGKTLFDHMTTFEIRRAKERQAKLLKKASRRK